MGAIRRILRSTAFVHVQYGGALYLNRDNVAMAKLRREWGECLKMLSPKCRTLSTENRATFNGMPQFDDVRRQINAIAFSDTLRAHEGTNLKQHRDQMIQLVLDLEDDPMMERWRFDEDAFENDMETRSRSDPMFAWIGAANSTRSHDLQILRENRQWDHSRVVQRRHSKYVPHPLPRCLYVYDTKDEWKDYMMVAGVLYAFTDGSIYHAAKIKKLRISGYGGGAVVLYLNFKKVATLCFPLSARTHIGIMEMEMFDVVLQHIIDNVAVVDGDHIRPTEPHRVEDRKRCGVGDAAQETGNGCRSTD